MAKLVSVSDANFLDPSAYCEELESGNILFFPTCPFEFPKKELEFLLAQKQTGSSHRKNIAYKPSSDKLTNFIHSSESQANTLHQIMRSYSQKVTTLLSKILAPYHSGWKLDYASFRPFQERGRNLRVRARNDLLHTDAFPSRPMHGSRILRFFTNINPIESRQWITSDPFHELAKCFGGTDVAFPKGISGSLSEKLMSLSKKMGRTVGLPLPLRSPYDSFMLNLHNFLKENEAFQKNCHKDYWNFPPNSCWMVYTDLVSHAATAGQYALEQTLIIPKETMVHPEKAPISTLERLTSQKMVNPFFCQR